MTGKRSWRASVFRKRVRFHRSRKNPRATKFTVNKWLRVISRQSLSRSPDQPMFRVFNCLVSEHDLRLVVIAGLVCFLASFTAINLFGRARGLSGRARVYWIVAAGAATGCGIWATHFIAMLSYDPGIAIAYNLELTALSLVMAMTITSLGLIAAIQARRVWAGAVGGSI